MKQLTFLFLLTAHAALAQYYQQDTAFSTPLFYSRDISSADMDNDGDKDILISTGGSLEWHSNDGMSNFGELPFAQFSSLPANVTKAVDMDGDGDLDILAAGGSNSNNSVVYWVPNTNGAGALGTAITITSSANNPRDIDASDLDGDGDKDVVFASYSDGRFKWCKNNGTTWANPINLTSLTSTWARVIKIVDIDNDGDNDVVGLIHYVAQIGQISWFKNDGSGIFTLGSVADFDGNNPFDFAIGDLDGDGDKDVAGTYLNSNALYWYQNDGSGTFSDRILIANMYDGASSIQIRDFDSDGKLDILCVASRSNIIGLFKNNGAASFQPYVNVNTSLVFGDLGFSPSNHMLLADDLNNDGKLDFAAINTSGQTVYKYINSIPPLSVTSSGNFSLLCSNSNNGAIVVTATGGTPPYSYTWNSSGINGNSVSNLFPGTYYCTINDANGLSLVDTIIISAPLALELNATTTLAYPADGEITVTTSGGTAPYSYLWANGETSSHISAGAGIYSCVVTDSNGCTSSLSATLNTLTPISVQFTLSEPLCFGSNDGFIHSLLSGGAPPYQMLWTNGSTTPDIDSLMGGVYKCSIKDSLGGEGMFEIVLNAPDPIVADFDINNATGGFANGSILLSIISGGTGEYHYLWNNNASSASISGLSAGDYSCTITDDNGCIHIQSFVVADNVLVSEPLFTEKLVLAPNPASEVCYILLSARCNLVRARLYNPMGRLIAAIPLINSDRISFSTSDLLNGIYSVELVDGKGVTLRKNLTVLH